MNFCKKLIQAIVCCAFLVFANTEARSIEYYLNDQIGDDRNDGLSKSSPFKSLSKVETLRLGPGDRILLAGGQYFSGGIVLAGVMGTETDPIVIETYSWSEHPLLLGPAIIRIDSANHGIEVINSSFVKIRNIDISGGQIPLMEGEEMRCGILVRANSNAEVQGIELSELNISSIYAEASGFTRGKDEVRTANGTQRYGWGIRFIAQESSQMSNISVFNCRVSDATHTGLKFTGNPSHKISDIKIFANSFSQTGGPGIQMSRVSDVLVSSNNIQNSGNNYDSRKWGRGSGLWTWASDKVLIERNLFIGANGPGDSAGCHIDFNCSDVMVQYNVSMKNAGGFCEILGNNRNCVYRYNISINDGWRVKGEDGAFQEGKIFWLSGYVGRNKDRKGPFNSYFYNNTIYVSGDIVPKIAISKTADGVLIANNIFALHDTVKIVEGDQFVQDEIPTEVVDRFIIRNNLYVKNGWPALKGVEEEHIYEGDPMFQFGFRKLMEGFLPTDCSVVKDKGTWDLSLPGDKRGLWFDAKHDIFGRQIEDQPDLGAFECPDEK